MDSGPLVSAISNIESQANVIVEDKEKPEVTVEIGKSRSPVLDKKSDINERKFGFEFNACGKGCMIGCFLNKTESINKIVKYD